jgi:hypothetical protein
MKAREKPSIWQCTHHYPIMVTTNTQGSKRARCLGCETSGPVRADATQAMWALRNEARYRDKVGV